MNDMTAFQRDILYIVHAENAPKGLEIKSRLEEYYDDEINHGRLYPNLDDLADQGLIQKGSYDKRTNKYELTKEGTEVLKARFRWEQTHLGEIIQQSVKFKG